MADEIKKVDAADLVDIARDVKSFGEVLGKFEGNVEEQKAFKKTMEDEINLIKGRLQEFDKFNSKVGLAGLEDEKKRFSFAKLFYAMKTGDESKAPFEMECCKQMEQKYTVSAQQATGGGSIGGYIVPPGYIAELIEILRAKMVVAEMGARFFPGLVSSPTAIPRQTTASTAYWVGEAAAITNSRLAFEQINLFRKKCGIIVDVSTELLMSSNPAIEAVVRDDVGKQLGLAIDIAAMTGAGTAAEPRGIVNTTGINTRALGTNADFADWDDFTNLIMDLEVDNAIINDNTIGFVTRPEVKNILKRTRIPQFSAQTDGEYVYPPIMSDAQMDNALGYKLRTTTQLSATLTKGTYTTATYILAGDWSQLYIGQWGALRFETFAGTTEAMSQDLVHIRGIQEVDVAVAHPLSFSVVSDAKTV